MVEVEVQDLGTSESGKGLKVLYGRHEIWLPVSQTTIKSRSKDGNTIVIAVPEWLAKDKGFID